MEQAIFFISSLTVILRYKRYRKLEIEWVRLLVSLFGCGICFTLNRNCTLNRLLALSTDSILLRSIFCFKEFTSMELFRSRK